MRVKSWITHRWFTDEMGREIDIECFDTLGQLRAALGLPADAEVWLTDEDGRDVDAECLFR